MKSIAVYEAKVRFSELLAAVQAGEEFEITKHGKPMARVIPAPPGPDEAELQRARVEAAFARLAELREGFVLEGDIKEIIAEGRR
jgi:prevent-host-death family protein